MERNSESQKSSAMKVAGLLVKWKKPLLIIHALVLVASILFSGPAFIDPLYKSVVVLFPGTTNSISGALLGEQGSVKENILDFGEEEQAEQLLQILYSDAIRDHIVQKFSLMKHYGIDSTADYPYTRLAKRFENNINFKRTEYMSVRIEVYDTDAQMAADIANEISTYLDSVKTHIQRERAMEGLKIVENAFKEKEARIKVMEDSLMKIRNHGVFEYESQSKILSADYSKTVGKYTEEQSRLSVLEKHYKESDSALVNARARFKGAEARLKELNGRMKDFAQYGGASVSLSEILTLEREQLSILRERYEHALVDAGQSLSHKFVVNKAVKAEKKSYPIRWLIVVGALLSAFLLSLIVISLLDRFSGLSHRTA